ncbi:hypothetical protein DVH24_015855 [Malus domestica]|uniref:Uncharacterized protein n=1 Tax=Malus domestica TaxID=3750 RepID=A0A498JDM3_MALDO|nr:hypothetical protein DVH24_015855 [Malus domestica]
MEICNGSREGAAAMSNKDVSAKAVRKHRKLKEWPGNIETQAADLAAEMVVLLIMRTYGLEFLQAMCVDSPGKQGKENALDQSEDVKCSDAAKQDELMEICNEEEMVLLL